MEDQIGWLSGGNQQKILFGRVLRDGVRLVILEDPTAGIDVQARAQIHRQIVTLAERGVGVLLVSNDIRETLSLCGRVHVFRGGKISATFDASVSRRRGGDPRRDDGTSQRNLSTALRSLPR